jgi:FHS family glucose/mannose:H+ symporter-like MFS transporter
MGPNQPLTDDMPNQRAAMAVVHAGFVVTGIITTLLGPLLPILIARWSMSDSRAGLFFTLQFFGSILGTASLSFLIALRGYRLAFFLGYFCMALGISTLTMRSEATGLMATAVYGFGLGLILCITNLWVAEIAASRRAAALSVVNFAWGIGAISCPVLVMFAQREHQISMFLIVVAAVSAIIAVTLGAMDIEPRLGKIALAPAAHAQPVMGKQLALTFGALFFFYVGSESSVGGWTAALAKRLGNTPGNLWALAPMFFWAGLLAGRALVPAILLRMKERSLLVMGLIVSAIGNATLLWVTTFYGAAGCVAVIGLGFAGIYPLLVAWMVTHYGEQAKGTASIMFTLAALGGATMPWLVGFTSTQTGNLRTGLLVPMVACLGMISLLALLHRRSVL